MAIQIQGTKVIDNGSDHTDATRAAQDRSKGAGGSVMLEPTAHVVVALGFNTAKAYSKVVDVQAAMASDVAAVADPTEVAALMKRKPAEVEKAHAVEVRATFPSDEFRHGGHDWPVGSAVVLYPDKTIEALSAADFAKSFKEITKAPKAAAPGQK